MAHCVVIADDLTGGNATGVLFRKAGYDAPTKSSSSKRRSP